MQINDQRIVGKMGKTGVIFLVLWSVLHIWVGAEGVKQYFISGESGLWHIMTGGSNAPYNLFQHATDLLTLNAHKHLLLNFCIDVGGYGVLGLFLSYIIYQKGSWMAYFIAIVVIGICDLTFLFSMVTPGIIQLNWGSVSGPIIWFVAVGLIPFGLPKFSKNDVF